MFDNIIIGGGHNGLTCAAYLAKAGQSTLVLEARDSLGGLASKNEFHEGFYASPAQSITHFHDGIIRELNLRTFGFDYPKSFLSTTALDLNQSHVILDKNRLLGVSDKDDSNYKKYHHMMMKFASALKPFWFKSMPSLSSRALSDMSTFAQLGIKLKMLGKKDMGEFLRVASLPVRDLMDEYFENDLLKTLLSWDGLIGSKMAPRSPNATILNLLYRMSSNSEGFHQLPTGGLSRLIQSLELAAIHYGVEVKRNSFVENIIVEQDEFGNRVGGVKLRDGTTIQSKRVISSADPKTTFLELLGAEFLEIGFTNRINRLRNEGYVGKLNLALRECPKFLGVNDLRTRMIIAADLDAIEFAFDEAKYGSWSKNLVMELLIPSLFSNDLCPKDNHVISINFMYVPLNSKEGWSARERNRLYLTLVKILEHYSPTITENIIGYELLTPVDIEERYNLRGGHWHHIEFSMDQMLMMRPTYESAQYATPISNLFLCGSGSHPAGGLSGGPGHNAAKLILKES